MCLYHFHHQHYCHQSLDCFNRRGDLSLEETEKLLLGDLLVVALKFSAIVMSVNSLLISYQLLRCRPCSRGAFNSALHDGPAEAIISCDVEKQ